MNAMRQSRRLKQSSSLKDRLASFAKEASEKASKLPPGPERESLLKKARQAETASRMDEWARDCAQHATHDTSSAPGKAGAAMTQLDDRTMANLDVVLEDVCRSLPHGGDHELRKAIAERLLDSALQANRTILGLTEVARAALAETTKKTA